MSGVGTELSKLIPDWAVKMNAGCGCKNVAKKWDQHGIDWCERNRSTLVEHLTSQSDKLIPVFRGVPSLVKRAVAERLLNKAIKNAKKKAEQ
jgi:hypothetical protein